MMRVPSIEFDLSALRAAHLWHSTMHIVLARKEKGETRNQSLCQKGRLPSTLLGL